MDSSSLVKSLLSRIQRNTKLGEDDFITFLNYLGNPDGLLGLGPVLLNLQEIISVIPDIKDANVDARFIDIIRKVTSEIIPPALAKENRLKFFNNYPKLKEANFEGLKHRSYVYAALGHRPILESAWPNYRHLLTQLFVCIFTSEESQNRVGETTSESACLAIRDLSHKNNLAILECLPDEAINTESYLLCLENVTGTENITAFPDLVRFFRGSLGRRKKPVFQSTETDPDDLPRAVRKIFIEEGGAPGEIKTSTTVKKGGKRKRRADRHSQRMSRHKATGKKNAIIRRNQNLSCDKAELSLNDLVVVMDLLASDEAIPQIDGSVIEQIKALIATMLWTGRSLKDVLTFRLCRKTPEDEDSLWLRWEDDNKSWRFPSPGPTIKIKPDETLRQCLPVVKHIDLPLPQHAVQSLSPYLSERINKGTLKSKLFSLQEIEAKKHCQGLFRHLKTTQDSEATIVNVARFLDCQLRRANNCDEANASLILGSRGVEGGGLDVSEAALEGYVEPEKRSIIKLHYTATKIGSLQDSYQQVTSRLESYWGGSSLESQRSNHATISSAYLGTPFRPRAETVTQLIERLKGKLRNNNRLTGRQDIINYHRDYLAYTSAMVNWCTAMRAIKNPALPWKHIDKETGFAVVCDKDDGAMYNSRRVWVPPMVSEQLCLFINHMHNLYNHLHQDVPSIHALFRSHSPGSGTGYIMIDDDLNAELLGPQKLKTYLADEFDFHLPANWQRHYLRSKLFETGCSNETINALMGHAEIGQEPWTRMSGFHPADFHSELSSHLTELMIGDGWESIPGIGGRK